MAIKFADVADDTKIHPVKRIGGARAPDKSEQAAMRRAIVHTDEVVQKAKRGRPVADKPWEREGVSRMTWYRRRKREAKP